MSAKTLPYGSIMETSPLGSLPKPKGTKACWLHDSMEYYKIHGITISPPKIHSEALLVGTDEEDEEEEPFAIKQLYGENSLEVEMENLSEEDEERSTQIEFEDDIESCSLNSNFDYSDDEIVFADSDEEEDDRKSIEEEEERKLVSPPFWFGNEDEDQLRFINHNYSSALHLPEEKKRLIRQPEPFVGRIKRNIVAHGKDFATFDVVEIYRRSTLPPGSIMPLIRKTHLLTCWSEEEGLPIHFETLETKSSQSLWKAKILKGFKPSTLLCLPIYGLMAGYDFFVTDSLALEVTHSPYSIHATEQHSWYEKYIPQGLRPEMESGLDPL